MLRARMIAVLTAACAAMMLAGCTAAEQPPPTSRPTAATRTPSPSPSISVVTPTISAQARDLGAREHATGTVTRRVGGVPLEYRVAADDDAGAICHRFARRWWQLTGVDGRLLGTYPDLTIGEVIVLTDSSEPSNPSQYGSNPVC